MEKEASRKRPRQSQEEGDKIRPEKGQRTEAAIESPTDNNTTVYLGGIPRKYCTETVVEKLMSTYGGALQKIRITEQSAAKGYCFCQFQTAAAAAAAIRAVNGRKLGGNTLTARPAHQKKQPTGSLFSSPTTTSVRKQRANLDHRIAAIKEQLRGAQP